MDVVVVLELVSGVLMWTGSAVRYYGMSRRQWAPPPSTRVGDVMMVVAFVLVVVGLASEHWRDALIAVAFLPMGLVSAYSLGVQCGAERSRATEQTPA